MMLENKILLDDEKYREVDKDSSYVFLEDDVIYLNIKDNVTCKLLVKAKVNCYIFVNDLSSKIEIHLMNEGEINLFLTTITSKKILNNIVVYHEDENTKSNVICHGVSYKEGDLTFNIDGVVPKGLKNCICNQDSMIHPFAMAKGEINPNLYIDEFDVVANHSAYIGPFLSDIIFYLKTKGIGSKESVRLLLQSFLLNDAKDDNYIKLINDNILKIIS